MGMGDANGHGERGKEGRKEVVIVTPLDEDETDSDS
jgi:hypothetical protein